MARADMSGYAMLVAVTELVQSREIPDDDLPLLLHAWVAAAARDRSRVPRAGREDRLVAPIPTAGTPEERTSLSNAATSPLASDCHFAICASTRFDRSSKTSRMPLVGA